METLWMWELDIRGMADGPLIVRKDHIPTLLHLVETALSSSDATVISLKRVKRTPQEADKAWGEKLAAKADSYKNKLADM